MNKRAIQPLFKVSCYLLLSLFLVAGWWGGGSIGPASAIAASGFFGTSDNVCEYWKAMFDFGVRIAGAFAFLFVVFAGAYWMFSAGDAKKVEKAKEMIGGALTGLALALLSYVLFWALNPYLTECKIEISELQMVSPSSVDPCAGVADDKLFAAEKDCQDKGGDKGGKCGGTCVQSTGGTESKSTSCKGDGEKISDKSECCNGKTKYTSGTVPQLVCDGGKAGTPGTSGNKGKWCCAGSGDCSAVVAKGVPFSNSNDKTGLQSGGVIQRKCPAKWCYNSSAGSPSDPCQSDGASVQVDKRACQLLVALKDAGLNPIVTSIVGNHTKCSGKVGSSSCTPPGKCNVSRHWSGNAVDLAPDDSIQKYISTNSSKFGVRQVIGPAGWQIGAADKDGNAVNCKPKRTGKTYSQYNCNKTVCGITYSAGLLCGHRDHIHIGW